MYMNSDIPCELFWPWKRVNLDPDEHPMPLTLTYLQEPIINQRRWIRGLAEHSEAVIPN